MVALKHDVFLEQSVVNLIILDKNILSDALTGVQSLGFFVFYEEDLSKSATTNNHQEIEVFKTDRLLICFVLFTHKLSTSQLRFFFNRKLSLVASFLELVLH